MQADALDVIEELEVPDAGGWLLIGTEPMGLLVDADGIFCNTRLKTIPDLKAAICVRPRWCYCACVTCGRRAHRSRLRTDTNPAERARGMRSFAPDAVCPRERVARDTPLEYIRGILHGLRCLSCIRALVHWCIGVLGASGVFEFRARTRCGGR